MTPTFCFFRLPKCSYWCCIFFHLCQERQMQGLNYSTTQITVMEAACLCHLGMHTHSRLISHPTLSVGVICVWVKCMTMVCLHKAIVCLQWAERERLMRTCSRLIHIPLTNVFQQWCSLSSFPPTLFHLHTRQSLNCTSSELVVVQDRPSLAQPKTCGTTGRGFLETIFECIPLSMWP